MRASLAMRSEPKIRRPVRISSPSRSRNARTSAFSISSGRLSGIARRPLLNARASAALSLPLASASGSTSPLGETARRSISSRPALRPLSTQRRSEPLPAPGASAMSLAPSGSLRGFRIGGLLSYGRGSRSFLVLEPMRAGGHDDLVALLFAEPELAEHSALVLRALVAAQRRTGFDVAP